MKHLHAIVRKSTDRGACAALLLLATLSNAHADDPKLIAGTLSCNSKGGVGLILGSQESLTCTFNPSGKGNTVHFSGKITKVGLDIGIKGPSVMVWTVLYSTSELPADHLAGHFAGVAADASLGLGAGAQVLVGGNQKGVVLQPVSVKGETGLNVALGVAGLDLVRQ